VNLGKNFRSLSPEMLQQYSLPVVNARIQGASVLTIPDKDQGAAERIFDVFRGTPTPSEQVVAPNAVNVRVLNGSGVSGQASDTTSALGQLQFSVAGTPGDATRTDRTVIRYGEGQEAKAQLLERYLVNGADIVHSPGLGAVDVVLVTGRDFEGVLAEPRAPAPADATTTPPPDDPPPAAPEC